ncbi:hypothetical protein GM415_07335 [Pseudodesulfovibrio cashew]|uniref:Nif11 domain-containing protein n=1 Tax=Pseudodesulfovibrio cashew TaxID=2678688 RepID=A0A6I6JB34_9BACT|nr:Nif11 family protein [Pseudodesulfovibrio cashew]QGY39945.1 hypothetical protein GM415_07335 [Pseudodesulfovibrio cashew]
MSQDELSRLVNDVMNNPALLSEAMTITDQAGMEAFITAKGYDLTDDERLEVWVMAAKILGGHGLSREDAETYISCAKGQ